MILRALKQWFSPDPSQEAAHKLYVALVQQSRKPWFYNEQQVPDTLDGRFDVIVLHMFLIISRLQSEKAEVSAAFLRSLSETFFADMDRSLRESGASDTGVGKRVKRMAEAFYGRMQSYERAFSGAQSLKEAIGRNLYRGAEVSPALLQSMEEYMQKNAIHLRAQPAEFIMNGEVFFQS